MEGDMQYEQEGVIPIPRKGSRFRCPGRAFASLSVSFTHRQNERVGVGIGFILGKWVPEFGGDS